LKPPTSARNRNSKSNFSWISGITKINKINNVFKGKLRKKNDASIVEESVELSIKKTPSEIKKMNDQSFNASFFKTQIKIKLGKKKSSTIR
jgi:hypothetical protein